MRALALLQMMARVKASQSRADWPAAIHELETAQQLLLAAAPEEAVVVVMVVLPVVVLVVLPAHNLATWCKKPLATLLQARAMQHCWDP